MNIQHISTEALTAENERDCAEHLNRKTTLAACMVCRCDHSERNMMCACHQLFGQLRLIPRVKKLLLMALFVCCLSNSIQHVSLPSGRSRTA